MNEAPKPLTTRQSLSALFEINGHALRLARSHVDESGDHIVAGLIAPRPQLICIGDLDPLTPPDAVDLALTQTRAAYAEAGAADKLLVHREANFGHQESPEMRRTTLAFFQRHLQQADPHYVAAMRRPA